MKYIMQQKVFAIGDDFSIKNEMGKEVYYVDGYGFSVGKRFSFQDAARNEIYDVKQKLLSFGTTFKIYQQGFHIATVKKAIGSLREVFYLYHVKTRKKIKIVGKLIQHEYEFKEGGNVLAEVSKKWFTHSDTYAIDIRNNHKSALILSAAVVVDLVCHDIHSKHNRKAFK